jgi:hypothetical protein
MTELLDEGAARDFIRERLNSKEWWLIVGDSRLSELIEKRYYEGEANEFFEVMIVPRPFLPISFARKREMGARELAACVEELGGPEDLAERLEEQDVLFPDSDPQRAMHIAELFASLVGEER